MVYAKPNQAQEFASNFRIDRKRMVERNRAYEIESKYHASRFLL